MPSNHEDDRIQGFRDGTQGVLARMQDRTYSYRQGWAQGWRSRKALALINKHTAKQARETVTSGPVVLEYM